jgi:hypothetical protein
LTIKCAVLGVLSSDGSIVELPGVVAAAIVEGELLCMGTDDKVIAKYPAAGRIFGRLEVLALLAAAIKRRGGVDDTQPEE